MPTRESTVSVLGSFAHSIRHKTPDVAELASNLRRVTSHSNNAELTTAEYSDASCAAAKLEEATNLMLEAATLLAAIGGRS